MGGVGIVCLAKLQRCQFARPTTSEVGIRTEGGLRCRKQSYTTISCLQAASSARFITLSPCSGALPWTVSPIFAWVSIKPRIDDMSCL